MANQVTEEWSKALRDIAYSKEGIIGPILAKIEEGTKIRRDHFVHGAISILAAYLILGHCAEFVCNLAGFVYPAYASYKALQTADNKDDTQWLTYWTVFGFLSVIEFASDRIVGWFPFYWLVKFILLLWLYWPSTRGAEVLYTRFIVPFMQKYIARLAEIEKEVKEHLKRTEPTPVEQPPAEKGSVPNGDTPKPDVPTTDQNPHSAVPSSPAKDETPVLLPPPTPTEPKEPPRDTPLVNGTKPEEPTHPVHIAPLATIPEVEKPAEPIHPPPSIPLVEPLPVPEVPKELPVPTVPEDQKLPSHEDVPSFPAIPTHEDDPYAPVLTHDESTNLHEYK